MRRLLAAWGGDDGGASAVEFALVLPVLMMLLLLGVNSWLRLSHVHDASSAVQTGARYYQDGGADDDAARSLALTSWPRRPADATLTVTRSCACADEVVTCSTICAGSAPPQTFITLSAQSTFQGLDGSAVIRRQETLRVR